MTPDLGIPTDPGIPTSLIAVLGIAVTTLAGVIAYLFRYYSKRLKEATDEQKRISDGAAAERLEFAKERSFWVIERTRAEAIELQIRTEFEAKHRILVESHARAIQDLHENARAHEDTVRREYLQNMESVSAKAEAAQARIGAVLEKFYDRYVVAPRGGRGY